VISFAVFGFLPLPVGSDQGRATAFAGWLAWALGCLALLKPASVVMVGRLHPRSGLIFLCSCAPFNAKTNCLVSEAVEEGCYLFCCYNSLDSLVNVWLLFIR
jgi:hypothetical protein